MPTNRFFAFLLCCAWVLPGFAQLSPAEAVAGMGRGINLGNTLEPPREGAWNNGPAQEAYFDNYVAAGFTNVRVPVRWDEHTAATAPFAIDAAWMDRVEEVIDWGLKRGLYITMNGHHEDWLKEDYSNATLRARYDAIWDQIIARFGDKSEKLLFEIINEPFGMTVAEVDDLNARILAKIRADNATRLVIFSGNQYSNSQELLNAAVPDDDYVIGYFHSYDPWPFAGLGGGVWGTSEGDYQVLAEKFRTVTDWSVANNVPVHLSEFGVVTRADYNSRMRFYAAFTEEATERGFAFSVWDDGGDFGVLQRATGSWPEVKDILIHTHADSPDRVITEKTTLANDSTAVKVSWRNRAVATGMIAIERSVGNGAFEEVGRVSGGVTTYTDAAVEKGSIYTYRLTTVRSSDQTVLHSYPSRVSLVETSVGGGVLNYSDDLSAADERFAGEPGGVTYSLTDGVLSISGDGTSDPYQTFVYQLPEDVAANVVGSNNLLYVRARSREGNKIKFRIDVADENDYSTTNAGRFVDVEGTDYQTYTLDFTGGYQDGGYGGTGCGDEIKPCDVNGSRIVKLIFYPEPENGMLDGTIDVDWFSFGEPLNDDGTGGGGSGNVINYSDDLTDANAGAQFTGENDGITYGVEDGVLRVVGDGTSETYKPFLYEFRDAAGEAILADVVASADKLFVRARSVSGGVANLRIDVVDENDYHTTQAGRNFNVSGSEFQVYQLTYTASYRDEAYGGTGCTNGPCAVDGTSAKALNLYFDPDTGGFDETIEIDWFSFGRPLETTSVRNLLESANLRLFPNPASDAVSLTFELATAAPVRAVVVDGLGRRVREADLGRLSAGTQQQLVRLEGLEVGLYRVQVLVGDRLSRGVSVVVR